MPAKPFKPQLRPWRRLYNTARWKALRLQQLAKEPLCYMCREQGLVTPADVVDHHVAHKGDEKLFFDPRNLRSICKQHHDSAKQKAEARGVEAIGFDADGNPIDPNHHWNK